MRESCCRWKLVVADRWMLSLLVGASSRQAEPACPSFPGSAWERTVFEAPPRASLFATSLGCIAAWSNSAVGRRSLQCSGFPGGAWEPVADVQSVAQACTLVPRLCLGTHCLRGSASRVPVCDLARLHRRLVQLCSRQAEPARQWVPRRSLGTSG